ncbi:MAG: dihydrofolate reductase [Bacteroides sp.]|nr:dihydrofolate reductase [Bacteroidales bacterium]MCI7462400.1 dipeptidyl peptidase 3 [Bacteroides sp.]MDY2973199.1 dihydrofolate reductase [Candidatus Cryptobacteroides sp.]HAW07040.1 dihydrofolate reductase [Rikenellaceae bacterium]MDD6149632.1 dihydrofolate reductase [Bacteroides sp.]
MKNITKMLITLASAAGVMACSQGEKKSSDFKYLIDEFADIKIMRYQIPGWDNLSFKQKEYLYHLSEAAKFGWDIYWDQNCKDNLAVRKVLQNILENYKGDRNCKDFQDFTVYAKRVFFSSGIHHHYAEDKFFPECGEEYFKSLMEAVGESEKCATLLPVIYSKELYAQRRSSSKTGDIVALSSVNFYEGVTRDEVEKYYAGITDKNDPEPISYGLNTKVIKGPDGKIREEAWKVGGIYGPALEKICEELEKAKAVAENDVQKKTISELQDYYRTGDLRLWDKYNITWVKDTISKIDFTNGFVEDYNDPLGRKAYWESVVNVKDSAASARTELLSANAQWFEDNAPIDPRFKKKSVKGVSAKVIDVTCLGGGCYPATPIGINLPNADWIRKEYGSKSVTIANITHAYDAAAQESPKSVLEEFAYSEEDKSMQKKYGAFDDEVHTDLHECLGHGSGQLLPGVSPNAMGEYASALEEARADLFGLYYIADPKLVELGILENTEAYKPHYSNYIRNGLMVQTNRVELGRQITEAHMQNRQLIAAWCYEHGKANNVIEKKVRDGKTYFVVNDYEALRGLFGDLLAEIQRIKSEGDYEAGKNLIMKYAVDIDPALHKEVLERYAALGLKPYGGFVNPEIVPVEKDGKVVDYKVVYTDDYLGQMLEYCHKYSTL